MNVRDRFLSLNPQQRLAATSPSDPLLIIAGAGTGKTNTLAHRVAHLVLEGVAPERILLLTFTRRAADVSQPTGRSTASTWCYENRRDHAWKDNNISQYQYRKLHTIVFIQFTVRNAVKLLSSLVN